MQDDHHTSQKLVVELRSYGRKRARKPSPRQQGLLESVLPRVLFDPNLLGSRSLTDMFPHPVRAVRLEIGFGGGEHMIAEARRNPDIGYIGSEPFQDGVVKALSA